MARIDIAMTGATGFVGAHLKEQLLAEGVKLRALVRKPADHELGDVDVVKGDLSSPDALAQLCADAPVVIHCAGLISATTRQAFVDVNVTGTANMVAAAQSADVTRFIHLSSLAAREPTLSDYAATKRAGEEEVERAGSTLAAVILRPPAVYGPGDRATLPLLRQLTQKVAFVPGSKAGRASLIHVRDLARALSHLARGGEPKAGTFELDDGRSEGYSWREMADLSGEIEGRDVACLFLPKSAISLIGRVEQRFATWGDRMPQLTPGKASELYHPDWVCRNSLLQDATDWAPQIGFEDGFRETVAWYRKAGWL
jgi:nucleoside-diphosphate-sugar epimerase